MCFIYFPYEWIWCKRDIVWVGQRERKGVSESGCKGKISFVFIHFLSNLSQFAFNFHMLAAMPLALFFSWLWTHSHNQINSNSLWKIFYLYKLSGFNSSRILIHKEKSRHSLVILFWLAKPNGTVQEPSADYLSKSRKTIFFLTIFY